MRNLQTNNASDESMMFELELDEVNAVGGGISEDASYGAAVGVAGGFLALGLGVAALTPVGMGVMLGASIISSGVAIYTAAQ